MSEQRYFAAVPGLLFGDRELEVGEPYPVEDGRDYAGMLRLGQISALRPATVGAVDLPAVRDFDELLAEAVRHGLIIPAHLVDLTSITWPELLECAADHGTAGAAEAIERMLRAYESEARLQAELESERARATAALRELERVAAELRELQEQALAPQPASVADDARHTGPSGAEAVEVPTTLPSTRAELEQLAAALAIQVKGTGARGFVKEADYVTAIEAERARRAAAA